MAYNTFIPIVNDGLVFSIDAYNRKSYVSGNTVTSDLVNGVNVNLINGVGFDDKSWTFDGIDDYIDGTPLLPTIQNDTQGTIEVWVRINDSFPTNNATFFSITDESVQSQLSMRCIPDGRLVAAFQISSTTLWNKFPVSQTFVLGEYTHVVLTQDGISPKIYINGEFISQTQTQTTDTTLWVNGNPNLDIIRIGASENNNDPPTRFWKDDISNIKYYNRPLTSEEVLQNYNALKYRYK